MTIFELYRQTGHGLISEIFLVNKQPAASWQARQKPRDQSLLFFPANTRSADNCTIFKL